jgi:hypothetical protein
VDLIVLHSISLPPGHYGGPEIEALFTNTLDWEAHPYFQQIRGAEVSAHFVIRRDGALIQFVSCNERAWHAGRSHFQGRDNCNDFSIGIELEGLEGHTFESAQYDSLSALSGDRVPALSVANFTRLPSPLSVSNPALSAADPDTLARGEAITWTPAGNDWVLFTLHLYNGVGADSIETITCVARDDGSFTPDSSKFTLWPVGVQLTIFASATRDVPGGVLPWNQANSRVAGINTIMGAVFTR